MEEPVRVKSKDIIDRLREHMLDNLEETYKVTYAPARYIVHLHPDDHDHLSGFFSKVKEGAVNALNDDLESLNRNARPTGLLTGFLDRFKLREVEEMCYVLAGQEWDIDFAPDNGNEIPQGEMEIESRLDVDFRTAEYGDGSKTINVVKRYSADGTSRSTEAGKSDSSPRNIFARIKVTYEDPNKGEDVLEMTKSEITIGRGRQADIRLAAPEDVSRIHIHIRYNENNRQFEIKDTSLLGITVNGNKIEGKDVWAPLSPKAIISLADKVILEFAAASQ